MDAAVTFFITGIVFGLSGGLTPGPLLTLIISETLRHNIREGIKLSFAPIFSDLPIVLASLYVISKFSEMEIILGIIALLGALYVAYLGYENIIFKGVEINFAAVKPRSLRKGIIANFVNPNPYIFWISIGAPTVLKAAGIHWSAALTFIAAMYIFMIGAKITVAVLVGKSKRFLSSNVYVYVIRGLGAALFLFSIYFFREALIYFKLI